MTVSPSDISTVLTRDDDFAHELRVGKAIHSCSGVEVRHGRTYTNPVTNKPRQFDYRCFFRKNTACLALAVECKNLVSACLRLRVEPPFENPSTPPKRFVGKSLVRIQTDKSPMVRSPDSDVYDKWAQALYIICKC
jgi:hypothetical protein